jgi:hypothetical protein
MLMYKPSSDAIKNSSKNGNILLPPSKNPLRIYSYRYNGNSQLKIYAGPQETLLYIFIYNLAEFSIFSLFIVRRNI